jgi:hypothetical protein
MRELAISGRTIRVALLGALLCAFLIAPSLAQAAAPPAQPYDGPPIDTSNSNRCDFLDPAVCLQPWPNDYFTVADPTTDTGRRLNLNINSTPKNSPLSLPIGLLPINPAEQNRSDGFSPGSTVIVRIPGLDNPKAFKQTGAVGINNMQTYTSKSQPIVVIDTKTLKRQPIWSEIDYNPLDPAVGGDPKSAADRAKVNLLIRPAKNFLEGHRYIVALRNLRDEKGNKISSPDAFRVYRDNLRTDNQAIEDRRPHLEKLFTTLGKAGIARSNLYMAWDFTVASEHSLTNRILHIRDDAFAQLGDTNLADQQVQGQSPTFQVTEQQAFTPSENGNIARIVKGSVTVPCYLTLGCNAILGSAYNLDANGVPQQAGITTANWECIIPRAAVDGPNPEPSRLSLYGHGLLGSLSEVEGGNVEAMAGEHNITFCATDWFGFAEQNVPNVLLILQDLSRFYSLVDETQQGFLNFLFLGRSMIHPNGFAANPAFQLNGQPVIDDSRLYYDGNSQGGILGGALTAVAPDFTRSVLGVPGMAYSDLLVRSVDFEPYAEGHFTSQICGLFPLALLQQVCNLLPQDTPLGLYDNYPNKLERPLIFQLMQTVWDRGEPNGYAQHMTTDPLPNTPPHRVLLQAAFGDHQVANVAAEVEARTIGASIYQPALEPGRYWNPSGVFGIPAIGSFPFHGSALVYWDGGPLGVPGGTATPPNQDIPPRPSRGCGADGTVGCGADPHSYPRNDVKARAQKSDFLTPGGTVNNYCTTANQPDPAVAALVPNTGTAIPCHSHGWLGP